MKVKVDQSCTILCNPMDYTSCGILQATILEWVAFPFSWVSSQPRDQTQVSHIEGGFFTSWATRETQEYWSRYPIPSPRSLPDPGIEPGSPALQAASLPTELTGKPRWQDWNSNTGPHGNRSILLTLIQCLPSCYDAQHLSLWPLLLC